MTVKYAENVYTLEQGRGSQPVALQMLLDCNSHHPSHWLFWLMLMGAGVQQVSHLGVGKRIVMRRKGGVRWKGESIERSNDMLEEENLLLSSRAQKINSMKRCF